MLLKTSKLWLQVHTKSKIKKQKQFNEQKATKTTGTFHTIITHHTVHYSSVFISNIERVLAFWKFSFHSEFWKGQKHVWNMVKVDDKDTRTT